MLSAQMPGWAEGENKNKKHVRFSNPSFASLVKIGNAYECEVFLPSKNKC